MFDAKNKQNETSLAVVRCQQYRGNPWWTGGSARIFSKSVLEQRNSSGLR
jgi:hypothetical protein